MDFTHNNSLVVAGINGTSADRYKIEELKWKYVRCLGRLPIFCAVKGCDGIKHPNIYTATAHVRKTDGRRSNNWYLVHQCSTHNSHSRNGMNVPLRKNAKLIPLSDIQDVSLTKARETKKQYLKRRGSDSSS